MEITIGRRVRFTPCGWSDGGLNILPAYMAKDVVGSVVDVSEERKIFRVAYEVKGNAYHECFKLPLIETDRVKILKN